MGEYMIVNPRRRKVARRGKKRAKKSTRSKRRRGSAKSFKSGRVRLFVNPRRKGGKKRRGGMLGGLKLPRLGDLNIGSAVTGAVGVVGSEQLTRMVQGFVPVSAVQSGPGRIALKIGVSLAAIALTKRFLGSRTASDLAAGAGIGIALDTYKLVAANIPGAPGLGEIVPSLDGISEDYDSDETVGGLGAIAEPAFAASW